MVDKIIAASLKIDTGNANTEIINTNKSLKDTGVTLKDTAEKAGTSSGAFSNLKEKIASLPGPLGESAESVTKLSTTFKALLANPVVLVITAIVGALALLYKAFASTNDGGEKVEQIMSGIGAAVDVVRDRVLKVGSALVKFFTGDFKGAVSDAKESVKGLGDQVEKSFNQASDATRRLQEANDELDQSLNTSRAKLNRDLAASKELITDETAGYNDRRKAIDAVREAEGKQTQAELANAEKRLKAQQDLNSLSPNVSDEDLKKAADFQSEVYRIQEQSAADQRNLNRQSRTIEREEDQKAKDAHQKLLDARKKDEQDYAAFKDKLTKLQVNNELASITDGYDRQLRALEIKLKSEQDILNKDLKARKLNQDQVNEINFQLEIEYLRNVKDATLANNRDLIEQKQKQDADAAKAITDRVEALTAIYDADTDRQIAQAQARKSISDAEVKQKKSNTEQEIGLINQLGEIVGKQTVAGKALGVATAIINTYQGASEALKQKSTLPSPFDVIAKVANVATVIATGLKTVREIVKVNVPGAGASGSVSAPDASSISASAPILPTQASTTIDQSSINGIGDATSGRAYVLSSDISRDADRNERLNRAARLGG